MTLETCLSTTVMALPPWRSPVEQFPFPINLLNSLSEEIPADPCQLLHGEGYGVIRTTH
jgi:hypothetical protein